MRTEGTTRTLGEVCEIIMGQSPDGKSYNVTGDGIPLINGPVEFGQGAFGKTIRSKFTTEPGKLCKENDLILCVRGSTTGKMNIAGFDACIGRGVAAIRAKQYQPWVNYFIRWKRDEIYDLGTGATFPNVSGSMLSSLRVFVPPLTEQKRIVGILDEAFDSIATAKANAEKNLQNARALFDSHLESVFSHRGPGWTEKKLREVAASISTGPFGTMLHKSDYVPDGIPLVNPTNIIDSHIVPSRRMMVNKATRKRLSAYVLQTGDIVIARRGELGRCALVTENESGWLCGTGSFFLRLSDLMEGRFFVALFSSSQFRNRLEKDAIGTTMSNLNHSILNALPIVVPPLIEQKSIMNKADQMLSGIERLESIYQQKLAALEALKKSLLHQAFNGQL